MVNVVRQTSLIVTCDKHEPLAKREQSGHEALAANPAQVPSRVLMLTNNLR